jgi:cytochrome c2
MEVAMKTLIVALPTLLYLAAGSAHALTAAEYQSSLAAAAKAVEPGFAGFSAQRGEAFYRSTHGGDWSCASCHTDSPVAAGTHAVTRKGVKPLAPAANPALHRCREDRKMVQAQLQRRAQTRLHAARAGRLHRLPADLQVRQAMKAILATTLLAASASVLAGDHAYGPYPAAYVSECGSCHVAFPPQLLAAPGWQAVMNSLDRHYGVDTGLDAKSRATIADYLQQNASRRDKHATTAQPPRLTQTVWFRKEHGSLPATATKSLAAAAQCESCHTVAERGDYNERGLKLPPGFRHKEK